MAELAKSGWSVLPQALVVRVEDWAVTAISGMGGDAADRLGKLGRRVADIGAEAEPGG